jgi:octaprenyl-diphosphate synthase
LENANNLKQLQEAVRRNLGSSLPFLSQIANHMVKRGNNQTRALVLLQSASLFNKPDQAIFDIGSTLEYLNTASALHQHIKNPENARRRQQYAKEVWGNEVSVLLGDYLLSISFQVLTQLGNLDVLECISLATQNISHAQVLEISEHPLTATPNHWRSVTIGKKAGLFGAGAQSAAYWGNSTKSTALTLFAFGEHVGMATKLKSDMKVIADEKLIKQKITKHELWSPLCFLLYECVPENERSEFLYKLKNQSDNPELITEIVHLLKKYDVSDILKYEAELELKQAKECLLKLEMDTAPLQPLTKFSVI